MHNHSNLIATFWVLGLVVLFVGGHNVRLIRKMKIKIKEQIRNCNGSIEALNEVHRNGKYGNRIWDEVMKELKFTDIGIMPVDWFALREKVNSLINQNERVIKENDKLKILGLDYDFLAVKNTELSANNLKLVKEFHEMRKLKDFHETALSCYKRSDKKGHYRKWEAEFTKNLMDILSKKDFEDFLNNEIKKQFDERYQDIIRKVENNDISTSKNTSSTTVGKRAKKS